MKSRPTLTPELARHILRAKQLAHNHQQRRAWALVSGACAGLALASAIVLAGLWTEWMLHLLIAGPALGLAATAVLLTFGGKYLLAPARCPECGHDWEIRRAPGTPARYVMTNWHRCPGCGVEMHDNALHATLATEAIDAGEYASATARLKQAFADTDQFDMVPSRAAPSS